MHFSTAVFVLTSALVASAADLQVLVGDGGLTFTPPSVTAASGDTINFEFRAKNHSVTQSTFANPCALMTTPKTGVDSGFQAVEAGATSFPQWSITIDDPTTPLWFFCAQTVPLNHCQSGMVFAVNAPPDKTFDAYQAKAKAGSTNSSAPTGGATGASTLPGAPATTPLGTASGTTALPTNSGFSTVSGTGPASTGTSTDSTSAPASTGNSALRLGGGASGLLALVGLVTGLML
ncbi:hypothetical protein FPV67DRAFT_1443283 [Lyophyllum atratum]|nr:hypothetical protein FPV67DRAFT_1443283 [Lyophyllum atratum]